MLSAQKEEQGGGGSRRWHGGGEWGRGGGGMGGGGERNSEKVILLKEKERHVVQSYSQNRWVFRGLPNAAKESASLIVCVRAFQNLGAELGKALKPNCLLVCFSTVLRIRRRGCDDERRGRAGTCQGMSSCKYSGAGTS